MTVTHLPTRLLVPITSPRLGGAVVRFPRITLQGGRLGGTDAADMAIEGSQKAEGPVVDQANLANEPALWAMLISHHDPDKADAWREGFAFRDYSQPHVTWIIADTAMIRGSAFTLYSAEPPSGMAHALVVHADDQGMFRSVMTSDGPMAHADLHNELRRRRVDQTKN